MNKKSFIFLLLLFQFGCKRIEPLKLETKELQAVPKSRDDAEILMSKELYEFYKNSDKKLEFYEIKWNAFFVLNYNPQKQTLNVSKDACSGWVAQYINVTEDDLKKISEGDLLFEEYGTLLKRQSDSFQWGVIKTNGCMGYQGK